MLALTALLDYILQSRAQPYVSNVLPDNTLLKAHNPVLNVPLTHSLPVLPHPAVLHALTVALMKEAQAVIVQQVLFGILQLSVVLNALLVSTLSLTQLHVCNALLVISRQ